MKRQKIWNLHTAIAIAFLVLGYFIEKDNTNIVGRIFIIFGAIIFVISIVCILKDILQHLIKIQF